MTTLFKVLTRHPADPRPGFTFRALVGPTSSSAPILASWRARLGARGAHLLNLYITHDADLDEVACTWTFSDRDTALLFKLSQ